MNKDKNFIIVFNILNEFLHELNIIQSKLIYENSVPPSLLITMKLIGKRTHFLTDFAESIIKAK